MGGVLAVFWTVRCGLTYQFSGFDYEDTATYALVMDQETSQQYPWTGEWLGTDGII